MIEKKVKIRDRARTCDKILDAVGQIIRQKGIGSVNSLAVAQTAGVNRVLVHRYFGTRSNLIQQYLCREGTATLSSDALLDVFKKAVEGKQTPEIAQSIKQLLRYIWEDRAMQRQLVAEITVGRVPDSALFGRNAVQTREPGVCLDSKGFQATLVLIYSAICYIGVLRATAHRIHDLDPHSQDWLGRIEALIEPIVASTLQKQ